RGEGAHRLIDEARPGAGGRLRRRAVTDVVVLGGRRAHRRGSVSGSAGLLGKGRHAALAAGPADVDDDDLAAVHRQHPTPRLDLGFGDRRGPRLVHAPTVDVVYDRAAETGPRTPPQRLGIFPPDSGAYH